MLSIRTTHALSGFQFPFHTMNRRSNGIIIVPVDYFIIYVE